MAKARGRPRPHPGVVAVPFTENAKVGPVAATYVSQESCPTSCPLKRSGCYAEYGPMGRITRRLNKATKKSTPLELAKAEAEALDNMPAYGDLRLHVVGDCKSDVTAEVVAAAAERFVERARRRRENARAWGYTHAWKSVRRESWGTVSILASCHDMDEVYAALAKGYAAALLVDEFKDVRSYEVGDPAGLAKPVRLIPCPYQTRKVQCDKCRLCMDDRGLKDRNMVIGFEAHGAGRQRVLKSLPVLEGV